AGAEQMCVGCFPRVLLVRPTGLRSTRGNIPWPLRGPMPRLRLCCGQLADGVPEMIITRSPLRISLGGGGTDLPSYYKKHSGFLIAAAIDRYVYITLHQTFVPDLIVKYSKLERVKSADELNHPIIRAALKLVGVDGA